jgi:hypothetical protein
MNPCIRPRVHQPLTQTDSLRIYRHGLVYPIPIRVINRDALLKPTEWFCANLSESGRSQRN